MSAFTFDSAWIRDALGLPGPGSSEGDSALSEPRAEPAASRGGTGIPPEAVERGEPVSSEGDSDAVRRSPRKSTGSRATDDAESRSRTYTAVAIDSREVVPGALFVALPGERVHGADFLADVAEAGARGAVVPADRLAECRERAPGLELFPVEDPLRALGDLAGQRRREADAEVVAVTGSSGKTTVKEMIHAALSPARRSYRTQGNLNSLSGLPLAVFRAPEDADVWVLEVGANRPGEIRRLAEIAAPDHAVVTTVGPAHLEELGSVEGVMAEKLSLVRGASAGGAVVVGDRPEALGREARRIRPDAVVAGVDEIADFRPDRHGLEARRAWFERGEVRYEVPVGGLHHLRDALIAAAVARALGVSARDAARGLAGFRPLGLRSHLREVGRLTVLVDCYNANPESFDAAIEYCETSFPGRRLAAVVGTMLELGEASTEAHRRVMERLKTAGFDLVAATGEFVEAARDPAPRRNGTRILVAPEPTDPESVCPALVASLRGDEVVLLKASRGVRLERVLPVLEEHFGRRPSARGPDGEGGE